MRLFGFNPCCIGLAIAGYEVRSLAWRIPRFQSLLYWISHCGCKMVYLASLTQVVSILVVLD